MVWSCVVCAEFCSCIVRERVVYMCCFQHALLWKRSNYSEPIPLIKRFGCDGASTGYTVPNSHIVMACDVEMSDLKRQSAY